jgi:hypothetical protein
LKGNVLTQFELLFRHILEGIQDNNEILGQDSWPLARLLNSAPPKYEPELLSTLPTGSALLSLFLFLCLAIATIITVFTTVTSYGLDRDSVSDKGSIFFPSITYKSDPGAVLTPNKWTSGVPRE